MACRLAEIGLAGLWFPAARAALRHRVERTGPEGGDQAHARQAAPGAAGELRRIGAGPHDAKIVVDQKKQVATAMIEERLECRVGAGVGHVVGGANA